jgi:predicted TIM-barrel fold metal-dependent hydrolase
MFSVDYPFVANAGALAFLTSSGLDTAAIEAIAHRNAEALLGI